MGLENFLSFIGAIFIYQLWILGHVVFWNFYDPSTSAFMQERLGIMKKMIQELSYTPNGCHMNIFRRI